jgi:hypothetical protein
MGAFMKDRNMDVFGRGSRVMRWLASGMLVVALLGVLGMAAENTAAMPAADFVGIGGAPCSYMTISDAIAAAADGDTIYIAPGTYNEQLGTLDKTCT